MPKANWNLRIARGALIVNFVGAGCLAFAFEATSSNFRFIAVPDVSVGGAPSPGGTAYAICADVLSLSAMDTAGNTLRGAGDCVLWDRGKSVAVVVSDRTWLLWTGLTLSLVGFALQFAATFDVKSAQSSPGPHAAAGAEAADDR